MNNEQIKALIAEQKKKANIVNNIAIEWENVKTAVAQIINNPNKESEEFINDLKARLEDNIVFQFFFPRPKKRRK